MRLRSALLPLIPLALLACSTAPKQPDEVSTRKNQAVEYTVFGNSYFNQARYAQALEFFTLALIDNIAVDNERGIVQSYNSIGKVYLAMGDLETAGESFQRALALSRKLADARLISQSAGNFGELYLIQGQPDRALALLEEASLRAGEKGMEAELAIVFHNIGAVYKRLEQLDRALDYLNRARLLNTDLKRYAELASNHYMIASIHSKQEDYPNALGHAAEALKYDKRVEHSLGIARDLQALGLISLKANQTAQGYEYLSRAYRVFQTLSLTTELRSTLEHLVDAAERLGRAEDAQGHRAELEALGGRS